MAALTRQQIQTNVQLMLDETEGKPGYNQPFSWPLFIDMITDELARLGAYWKSYPQDIVSGTSSYSQTVLFQVRSVIVTNGSAVPSVLAVVKSETMDLFQNGWRAASSSATPQYVVAQGINNFLIWPTPNYNAAGGFVCEGFATPSNAGTSGVNIWPNQTDVCPLPERVHNAVVYGVAALRCMQFKTPENEARLPDLVQKYMQMYNQLGQEIRRANPSLTFDDGTSVVQYPASTNTTVR